MKLRKYKVLMMLTLMLTAFSCEDFLADQNVDPNKPISVSVSGQLSNVELILVDTWGGAFSRFNTLFMQQVQGVARQWTSFDQYVLTPNRFDNAWQELYENVLVELVNIKQQSIDNGYNHYLGVANVLEASAWMMATDVWGDIPFPKRCRDLKISTRFLKIRKQ